MRALLVESLTIVGDPEMKQMGRMNVGDGNQ